MKSERWPTKSQAMSQIIWSDALQNDCGSRWRRRLEGQEVIASHVANHLQWMKDMEARGKIWASGPFPKEGILVGDGMTILDASNEG
jgi:hypothetical protein